MKFVYLHGYASSPQSVKARAFESVFREAGIALEIPALPATIPDQFAIIENLLAGQPTRLIGSSLGGRVAALYAARHPEVERLVLLAPAFGFAPGTPIPSALRLDIRLDFTQPALIFHGVNDDVVPIQYSRDFTATHPNANLLELQSGHDLLDVLDRILAQSLPFLI